MQARGLRPGRLLPLLGLALAVLAGLMQAGAERRGARGSLKDLQLLLKSKPAGSPTLGQCDFDRVCDWFWNATDGSFQLVKPPLPTQLGPSTDASRRPDGKFLYMPGPGVGQLASRVIPRTGSNCYLEVALYQVAMKRGTINLVIETFNKTSYLASMRSGNDNATWERSKFHLGSLNQEFSIILEMQAPFDNSSIAVDDIDLVNCFPESRSYECTESMFRCNNGSCLKREHVCDLTADCADGEDETGDCDKVPEHAKCNFEGGWCGWSNVRGRPLNWTLHQGPMPSERMGPVADHTYRNGTGTYAYVDMSKTDLQLGSRATINSPIFNPTPPYNHQPGSPYKNSCKVRFFYHQYGSHTVPLGLYLVQLKPQQNYSQQIWRYVKDNSDSWNSQLVTLPDVRYRYYLQFEASKSYASKAVVAIDDISLSPECFGVGVPADILADFNYYDQKIPPEGSVPPKHADFTNKTIVRVSSCGQTGRIGPTPEQCVDQQNGSDALVEVLSGTSTDEGDASLRFKGIQRWIAPSGGYYTIIAMGARGGAGALSMGVTMGAMVRGVIELEKGQQLYFMVGQPGTDACPKSLGAKNDTCSQPGGRNASNEYVSIMKQVKNIEFRDGGGGGGGATYIFTLKPNGEQQPLLIAGGGGGLGPTQFRDDGVQHAKGATPPDRAPYNGVSFKKNAGGGGGWIASSANETSHGPNGMALTKGGIGGIGCGPNNDKGHGDGGFGGGGGGCLSGGGGGGYAGGDTGQVESGNGEGGYSFASADLLHVSFAEKANAGPGEVLIIPAISGCGCDFRCVVVDRHLSETHCLCPAGWQLGNDSKACVMSEPDPRHQTVMVVLIIVSIGLIIAFSGLCFLLYNRYQNRKELERRRQVMFGNGTELTSLRVVSDSMMTEFNPNYEFAGNLYSFKDLPQIPRDSVTLVKPLGQGAFGEVFQGVYKYSRSEEHPVAVKTLPSVSTSQAEADFMMEALIMSKFEHPNIVQFIGISFDKHPRYIVLELLAGGDLKNFLREERPRPDRPTTLTMQSLIMCAYDVAKGCKYMEEARFIHRDIAARNCLLSCKGPGRVVKIADFGMARDIYRSDYYRKGGKAMLPIKWMPPESFLDGIFTTKTDVWAFGVLLWEIMSFGYMPYTGCANREVMSMVTSGGRLERPAGCPDPIYGIMTRCWHPHPEERPSFSSIVERIGYCLQDPDVINHPTPNYDLLPICEREITIMRPDPETECINVQADSVCHSAQLDGCGYVQPRLNLRPAKYRIGQPAGIVYASLRHGSEDRENRNGPQQPQASPEGSPAREHELDDVCDNREQCQRLEEAAEPNANPRDGGDEKPAAEQGEARGQNGNNGESTTTTDTNSDSIFMPSSRTPPDTASSSPNTRTSSPNHAAGGPLDNGNSGNSGNPNNNVNGVIRKSALKAALSLDPSALCRGAIPYEKMAFSPPKPRLSNPGSAELARKDSLSSHGLPREEECSC
ncbi:leukocyte tyrosine kinase receptor isoform X2 [Nasonia vitripennis]|uniref:Tyrosine-protein kinase receptor n=1 Tax=Nasonia vitripennis TaxID=7425 RepID=A0A7M7Q5N4_NASVI|nr:leukocyte tyrosine kinase receptor isoform X2 [Nasonia vitripennis]